MSRKLGVPNLKAEFASFNGEIDLGIGVGTKATDESGYTYILCQVASGITLAVNQLVYSTKNVPFTITTDESGVSDEMAIGVAIGDGTSAYFVWVYDISQPGLVTVNASSVNTTVASGFALVISVNDGAVLGAATALANDVTRVGICAVGKLTGITTLTMQTPFSGK